MELLGTRFTEIQTRLQNWWENGDQESPCLVLAPLKEQHKSIPQTTDLTRYWSDLEFRMNRSMKIINNTEYYGEAVPHHYIDFGASAMVGAMNGRMEYVDQETIWAHPVYPSLEAVLDADLEAVESNPFYVRMRDLVAMSAAQARGHHFIAHFAHGGLLDNLAGLYGTENMLIDLYEKPTLVKKALERLKRVWIEVFAQTQAIIDTARNPGGIGWAGIWAPGSTFPLQEDISYMLSPAMFGEFSLPHIADLMDAMDCPLYHLDGVGAIPHLDSLLNLGKLKAIQWVPGAGKEKIEQWYELIRKILAHGKSCQVFARADEVADLIKNVGSRGLLISCTDSNSEEAARLVRTLRE